MTKMENTVFLRAYNKAYLASAYTYAQIPLRGTSDTLGTLCEMPEPTEKMVIK